jgi:hypothetical protein
MNLKGHGSNESGPTVHEFTGSNTRSVILTASIPVVAANISEDTENKELACVSKNLVTIYKTTRRHIPKGSKGRVKLFLCLTN